jgi:hypothetical protein
MNEMKSTKPVLLRTEDAAYLYDDDGHDVPFRGKQGVAMIYGVSRQLTEIPGAEIGDFDVPQGDKRALFKASTGFLFHPIGFELSNPEYTPDTPEGRGTFVIDHGVRWPEDSVFLKQGERGVARAGRYRIVDGKVANRVVPTVAIYGLVGAHGVSYSCYGTAFAPAKDLAIRAERLRVKAEIDGRIQELQGCTLGLFQVTSAIEKKGDRRYPVPVFRLVGKLGEPGGPTPEQWRLAKQLRQAFKQGEDWVPAEAIDPPAPPVIDAGDEGAWNDGAPGPDRYEGPNDLDDVDF